MDILPFAALMALFGGLLFGVVIAKTLPYLGIPKIGTALTMKAGVLIAFLFWSTWIMPQVVLLAILSRPLTITLILTGIFIIHVAGVVVSTYLIGKRGHYDDV